MKGFNADTFESCLEQLGYKVWAVIGTDVFWFFVSKNQRIKCLKNLGRAKLCANMNRECLARIFIHYYAHFILPAVAEFVMNKINGPNVALIFGPQANDIAVLMIKSPPLLMPVGQMQTLLSP